MRRIYEIILLISALMFCSKWSLVTHLSEGASNDASSNAGRRLSQGSTSFQSPTTCNPSNSQPDEATEAKKPQDKFDEYYSGFGMLMHQQ